MGVCSEHIDTVTAKGLFDAVTIQPAAVRAAPGQAAQYRYRDEAI
ncbi:MAG: hypothetical protein ACR2Q3_14085 [Woeseiaceae bacterium]